MSSRPRYRARPVQQSTRVTRSPPPHVRRRRAGALVLAAAAVLSVGVWISASATGGSHRLQLKAGGGALVARIPISRYMSAGRFRAAALRAALDAALPVAGTSADGRIRRIYAYDVRAIAREARLLGRAGGSVRVSRRVVSTRILAPVRRQQQANTCEAAALSILLSTIGRPISEGRIQGSLPTSGTPDPQGEGAAMVWGDPDVGYVGRADGGGTAGGFGVYPGPVIAVAKRFGAPLRDLTGQNPSAVYASLLHGRAVMAWVGLSPGPIGTWSSPEGKPISVNFGEHTVVLHGVRGDGSVLVSNPLRGTEETWTRERFERMWALLGNRAVAT